MSAAHEAFAPHFARYNARPPAPPTIEANVPPGAIGQPPQPTTRTEEAFNRAGAIPVGQHNGRVLDAELDYYGKLLASAGTDSVIRVWDISSPSPRFITEIVGHEGPVWKVSWAHPQFGRLLASCGADGRVIVWRQNDESPQPTGPFVPIYTSEEHTAPVQSVQFSPWEIGLHIACASSDGTISVHSYAPESGTWDRRVSPNSFVLIVDLYEINGIAESFQVLW